jgi:methylenetetrahydrofolate reductase (NADPH)
MKASSNLQRVLDSGQFAVTAEIGPPKGANPEIVRKHARNMKGYADAFNLTDNQTAVVRLSSWAASLVCLQEELPVPYRGPSDLRQPEGIEERL